MSNSFEQFFYSLKKMQNYRGSQPVYFLIYNNGVLHCYFNYEIQNAMSNLICKLRSNPTAIENLRLSIISGSSAKQIIPLQNLSELDIDNCINICSYNEFNKFSSTFKLLFNSVEKEVTTNSIRGKIFNDALPIVFILHSIEMSDKIDRYFKKRKIGIIIKCFQQKKGLSFIEIEELNNINIKAGNVCIIFDGNYEILFSYISELLLFAIDYDIKRIPSVPSELYLLY